jgi:hypothetical protein
MIVWHGRGFLSVLVLIIVIFLFSKILPQDYEDFAIVFGFLSAGIFSWYFGKKWNSEHGKLYIDKETGKEIEVKSNHSLFWIKMQYWGVIFTLIAIILLVKTLF